MSRRVTLMVTEAGFRSLQSLKERAGLAAEKEVFDRALQLLDWAAGQVTRGRRILTVVGDGSDAQELASPVLDAIRKRSWS